jgi:ribosomal protection tetracycline resistance protein
MDPAPNGSGIELRLDLDGRLVPIYIFKTFGTFLDHMEEYVRETLREGLSGWQVADCTVTITDCGYRAPGTTAGDFRRLTPPVLMRALEQARTVVCEPIVRVNLELPTATIGGVMAALARLGAAVGAPSLQAKLSTIEAVLPSARAQDLQRQLPGLTGGEGVLDSTFAGYQPVSGDQPTRRRTTANPLNLDEYMMQLPR